MIYLVLLAVGIILIIIILNFKRQKKKYLPISSSEMTEKQQFYIIKMIKNIEQSYLNQKILINTDELIYKIRNNELSNMEIENINKVLLNSTIKIGIFNFK
ncbi:MAG: hypothetical protein M0Q88_05810 [Bacilli bacterium]|nr:hypothetical protein [Bacilli bacterium]